MKNALTLRILAAMLLGLASCARFTTTQTDTSYDECGKPLRTITTKASCSTWFESSSALANFKAVQTDKSQSAAVGSLGQETHAMTNITDIANKVVSGAVEGAVRAAIKP